MAADLTQRALLLAHPGAWSESVWSIAVEAQLIGTELTCRYALHGDMAHIRLPAAGVRRRADDLWRHTCFEAFVGSEDDPGYYEFNFSPTLEWAAYRFEAYREGMTAAPLAHAPGLQVHRTAGQLDVTAKVHLEGLRLLEDAQLLHVGLSAVVEEVDGRISYWALQHPPGDPDFHHPAGFVLELSPA